MTDFASHLGTVRRMQPSDSFWHRIRVAFEPLPVAGGVGAVLRAGALRIGVLLGMFAVALAVAGFALVAHNDPSLVTGIASGVVVAMAANATWWTARLQRRRRDAEVALEVLRSLLETARAEVGSETSGTEQPAAGAEEWWHSERSYLRLQAAIRYAYQAGGRLDHVEFPAGDYVSRDVRREGPGIVVPRGPVVYVRIRDLTMALDTDEVETDVASKG